MGKYRTLGVDLDRQYRNDLNANFTDIDTDIKAVQSDVNAKNTARINDIDAQKKRVDDLIVGTPQPSEVVDARGGFTVLRDRLNGVDTSLADMMKQPRKRTGSETNDTNRVQELFTSKGKLYFPKDTYVISSEIRVYDDTEVICHPQATFKLADNARCKMFASDVTTGKKNFKWSGGIIDGNDANQGSETGVGTPHDVSRAFLLINFYKIEVEKVLIKSIRGHAIGHWGNEYAYFRDIEFRQGLSPYQNTLFPSGGSRRDGITGASRNMVCENLTGFTEDDFIAVCPGCIWEGNGTLFSVDNVFIRNIKMERNDVDPSFATYRGLAVYSGGYQYKVKNMVVENVNATVNTEFMRIQGVVDNLSIKEVNATIDMKNNSNGRGFMWVRMVQNNGGSEEIGGSLVANLNISKVSYQYVNADVVKSFIYSANASTITNLKIADIYGYYPVNITFGGAFITLDSNCLINNIEIGGNVKYELNTANLFRFLYRNESSGNAMTDHSTSTTIVKGDVSKRNTTLTNDIYRSSSLDTMFVVESKTLYVDTNALDKTQYNRVLTTDGKINEYYSSSTFRNTKHALTSENATFTVDADSRIWRVGNILYGNIVMNGVNSVGAFNTGDNLVSFDKALPYNPSKFELLGITLTGGTGGGRYADFFEFVFAQAGKTTIKANVTRSSVRWVSIQFAYILNE